MKRLAPVLALLVFVGTAHAKGKVRVITTGNTLEGTPWTSLAGPAGPGGPLGLGGPSAKTADPLFRHLAAFHPSTYISGLRAWNKLAAIYRKNGGPTSDLGILAKEIDWKDVHPDFRPGGRYALVGFTGVLGLKSLRGQAGDTGAHGFLADEHGNYHDHKGRVVRTFLVGNRRQQAHELYELYDEETAKHLGEHGAGDTSFAAAGRLRFGETDTFTFPSRSDQHVIIAAVPEKFGENYDLTIRDADSGELITRSTSLTQVNHGQLWVPKGTNLEAQLRLRYSLHPFANTYKLFVVGENN